MSEAINTMGYIHTVNATQQKRNKLLMYQKMWLNPKIFMPTERNQTKKSAYYVASFLFYLYKSLDNVSESLVAKSRSLGVWWWDGEMLRPGT